MTAFRLLLAEIGYRRVNFLLCVLAVLVAATLFLAGPTLITAYSDETSRKLQEHNAETERMLGVHSDDTERLLQRHNDETASLVGEQETRAAEQLEEMRERLQEQIKSKETELDGNLEKLISENEAKLVEMQEATTTTLSELEKETKKATRDLGFNLNIVHKDTTLSGLFMENQLVDMPEDYIHKLADAEEINMIRHLVGSLQQKIKWNDRTVLLVGFLPEVHQAHMSEKPDMVQPIETGTVVVGHEIAASAEGSDGPLKEGDTIQISGPGGEFPFKVAKVTPEHGTQQDVTLSTNLDDAQKILDKPDRITQIMALGCHCSEANLPNIREKLSMVLPDTNIREHLTRRIARAKQRDNVTSKSTALLQKEQSMCRMAVSQMKRDHQRILGEMERNHARDLQEAEQDGAQIVAHLRSKREDAQQSLAASRVSVQQSLTELRESGQKSLAESREGVKDTLAGLLRVAIPLVVIASAAFVGLMLWNNVRERRQEIAVLRAIGKGAGMVAALVLGRALVLGILGGALGCLVGFVIARALAVEFPTLLMVCTLVGAPLVAMLASYLPTRSAVRQDPAVLLQDQ